MANVFISYSRTDQAFVRQLYAALEAAKREAWVDWEGIPSAAKWLTEIYGAIDGADTFISIITLDYLASETCGREVTYAIETKKRIIPIVCRQVEAGDVKAVPAMAPLGTLNWIFLRESDNFDQGFQKLLTALDTDLDYWHLSSRLQVRAREWEGKQRSPSFTLQRKELEEAEAWITQGANKQPSPSALQLEYISASRRNANNQQRRLLAGVSTALIVTLVLAIISSLLFQTTRAQNITISGKNKTISGQNDQLKAQNAALLVRALAGDSSAALGSGNIDQALLLGAEASQRQDTIDTRNALFAALENSPYLDTILQGSAVAAQHPTDLGRQVMYSQDGKTLLSATRLGRLTVWDMTTRQPRAQIAASCPRADGGTATVVIGSALSPDGQMAATALPGCAQQSIDLWNANTGALIKRIPVPHVELADVSGNYLAFSPDSHEMAVPICADQTCTSSFIQIFDTHTFQLVEQVQISFAPYFSILFTPDGKHLVVSNRLSASLIDLAAKTSSSIFADFGKLAIFSLALSPDGKTLGLGGLSFCGGSCSTGAVVFIDMASHAVISTVPLSAGGVGINALAISPDGRTAVAGANFQLDLIDIPSGAQIGPAITGHTDAIRAVAFAPDGVHFASTAQDDQVLLWRRTPNLPASIANGQDLDGNSPAALSPDGKQIATYTGSGEVAIWDASSGNEVTRFSSADAPNVTDSSIAFGPDNNTIALTQTISQQNGTSVNEVRLWDIHTHQPTGAPFVLPTTLGGEVFAVGEQLFFSADGRYLAWVAGDKLQSPNGRVAVWQVASRSLIAASANTSSVAFSSDSSQMAFAFQQGTQNSIKLVDIATGQTAKTLAGGSAAINGLAFSPHGHTLASIDLASAVTIWDLATGKAGTSFVGAASSFTGQYAVAYSPDGKLLMASDGRRITLWDTANSTLYLRPIVDPQTFNSVSFSPDSQFLVESEEPGPVILRYLTVSGWQQQACAIANRNLTQAEWKQFIGNEPYHKTCANLPAGS